MVFRTTLIAALLGFAMQTSAWAIPGFQPPLQKNKARLSLTGNHYLTGSSNQTNADVRTGNLGLGLGYHGEGQIKFLRGAIALDSLFGLRKSNYRYLDISEAYFGYEFEQEDLSTGIFFGRKKSTWSALDSYWTLGLYQPRFRWDYLNEHENGLTGLSLLLKSEIVQFNAFYSPFFIPEQGAPSVFSGGTCKTSSPWFTCPSSSIFLFNQPTAVNFKLDVPPLGKMIFRDSYGLSLRLGGEKGFFGRASYTNKPINQFLLSYEGLLDLTSLQLPAIIHPRILRHDLYGIDVGFESVLHSLVGSLIWENPKRDITPDNWNTQEATDAFYAGAIFKTQPLQGQFSKTRFEFSFLRRDGGIGKEKGPFASNSVNIFEPRQSFRNAYSVSMITPIFDKWDLFQFSTKFILDTANNGNILITDLHYKIFKHGLLNIGLDMLGSDSSSVVDFISRYQRNDRIRGGLAYAF